MKKLLIGLLFGLGLCGTAHAVNPIYGTVRITTTTTISPPVQNGSIFVASGTIQNVRFTTATLSNLTVSTFTVSTSFNASGIRLTNVSTPTAVTDASTKGYADSLSSGNTHYILNGTSLQSATFNVSSGTVTDLNTTTFGVSSMTSTLPMSNRKITGLASGTASTDGMAFGQLKVFQVQCSSSVTQFTTTQNTFQNTNSTITFSPTSASSKITIVAAAFLEGAAGGTNVTIARNGTNILSSAGQMNSAINAPCTLLAWDNPATTSPTSYTVQIKSNTGGQTSAWGETNFNQSMCIIEWQ